MANKSINYMARNFSDFKSELISMSQKYYPTLADSFNDSSVGAWFIDLVSAVGDDLSYYIDRAYQETNIDSAMTRKTVLNIARTNGLKVPGKKAAMCEVEISCNLPVDPTNIASPDWDYAPILRRTTTVSNGNMTFELSEDVNFAEQFNDNAYSNRRFTPRRNTNGGITGYTVSKSVIAVAGSSRVYTKVISRNELEPFMEIVLPERNVMSVESIIFKEGATTQTSPAISEYFVDEEVYIVRGQAIKTHRFFEVDSLVDQYRFATATRIDDSLEVEKYNPEVYEDYTETSEDGTTRTMRYYVGQWKPITQKFITEYTDNGYMKITFGSGVAYDNVPDYQTTFADYMASNLINNDMLGVLPEAGWTMYVLYKVGGGVESNVSQGALNNLTYVSLSFPRDNATDNAKKSSVSNSLSVTNVSVGVAGKDAPSVSEIKNMVKYNTNAQNRCVTLKDYNTRVMQMPPRYGSPFRANAIEENNKISMAVLNLDSNGRLTSYLPSTLVENMMTWLTHFKSLGDYIEVKSGKIYNIGFLVDAFVDKNYDSAAVVQNIISTVYEYMNVASHDMAEDIFLGDLEKEINMLDGVIAMIGIRCYNIVNGGYSSDYCPLPIYTTDESPCSADEDYSFVVDSGAEVWQINLDEIDHVLYGDYNAMYEVRNRTDIRCRIKLK